MRRSTVSALAVLVGAALAGSGAAPAGAIASAPGADVRASAACTSTGPATVSLPDPTATLGGLLRVTGTGWCHPDGSGSRIAIKLDDGDYSRTDSSVNPNRTVWAVVDAAADGTFATDLRLPDGTTATSTPTFPTGQHTLRLLTGSLKNGDTVRTAQSSSYTVTSTAVLASAQPRITGQAKAGRTVKAVTGSWTSGTSFTYWWKANGKNVAGGTRQTLALKAGQRGKRLTVTVTGRKDGYTTVSRTSAAKKVASR